MFRFVIVALVLSAAWAKPSRMFEDELTMQLQNFLEPMDPYTVAAVTDANVVTDHADLTFSATDLVLSGFSHIQVTKLDLAIPGISHQVNMVVEFPELSAHTDNYVLHGTHDSTAIDGSGAAYLTFHGVTASVSLDTDKVAFSPITLCIKKGTLAFNLENTSIEGHLDGLDDINAHISEDVGSVVAGLLDKLNAQSETIEDTMNLFFCH